MGAQELHQVAQPGLAAEVPGNLLRLPRADPLDSGQLTGAAFDNIQGSVTETIHNKGRCCRAYAAHRAAGKIGIDRLSRFRQPPLGVFGLKLLAMGRMLCPGPDSPQRLSRSGRG